MYSKQIVTDMLLLEKDTSTVNK
jgi:hypothetical protein